MKLALLLLLILTACATAPVSQPNVTEVVEETGASLGDLVTINFSLEVENGSIVDTNDQATAQAHNILNYVNGPYTFILGQSGKVQGFDEALLAMKEGDHRETIIEPSEEELTFVVNKTKVLKRHIAINRKQAFPVTSFETFFGRKPRVGDVVFNDTLEFKYQVLNVTNESVITNMVLKEGEKYKLPNTEWESAVVKLAENDVMFYYMPEANQTIETPFGPAMINFTASVMFINFQPVMHSIFNKSIDVGGGFSIPQKFQVVKINEGDFVIKRYGSLADKRLKLKADMIKIIPDVKEVRQDKPLMTEAVTGIEN